MIEDLFTIICNKCGSKEADVEPVSNDGYWDDGYVIVCPVCGSRSDDAPAPLKC